MGRQTQIPGTEIPADDELERVADEYHTACATRREAAEGEATRRSILLEAVEERIKDGRLQKPDGDNTCVYSYVDEEGRRRFVHYLGKAKVKVNTAKKVVEPEPEPR